MLNLNNRSKTPGVTWHKRNSKWTARLYKAGHDIHLGYFDSEEDAIAARKTAEKVHSVEPRKIYWTATEEDRKLFKQERQRKHYLDNKEAILAKRKAKGSPEFFRSQNMAKIRTNPIGLYLSRIRQRARKKGIPFDLDKKSISIPDNCECCGRPMFLFKGNARADQDSVSCDRLIPERGYIADNVRFICWECNRLKSDCTDTSKFFHIWMYMMKNHVVPMTDQFGIGSGFSARFPKLGQIIQKAA